MIHHLSFRPHGCFRGGHLQTLAGFYWPSPPPLTAGQTIFVDVSDGDKIALHDGVPAGWRETDQVVFMVHGLAGCHGSGYMVRIARKLNECGIRTFRMDMRGVGASCGYARLPGHAGRTGDAAAAIRVIAARCPQAPLTLVGFSLGGNIALGTLADASTVPCGNLIRGIAVAPPVDLSKCCREMRAGVRQFYDRYLVRLMVTRWQASGGKLPSRVPSSIYQFDEEITAPLSGYRDAEDYYWHASSGRRLEEIRLPTRILAARDDPLVAFSAIEEATLSEHVEVYATKSGGHLGYFSHRSEVIDRRWMDATLISWIREASWQSPC